MKRAAPHGEATLRAPQGAPPALGHRPTVGARPVESDVYRAVVLWIVASGPSVVGGEHAADKGDYREALAAVLAQRIDVPPDVAARLNRLREVKSAITRSAASLPESAAIGMPGPGCTLPPAR